MTNMSASIRLMKESDLQFVRRGLSETNWQDIPEDQRSVLKREDCDKRIFDDFDYFAKTEKYKFKVFIATTSNDDSPVGYVSVGETTNPAVGLKLGSVLDFWVSPEFRGQGVGSELLDYAVNYIQSMGYSHASILVSASNEKAIQMYEKRGFNPDRIILVKRL
jgi:ribosomal protein S18 acetylase RimI-like enzyme